MHRFNRPPGWPAPPSPDWQPPRGWLPEPDWPQPPKGWKFWVNERGGRALGPVGVYGSTSRGRVVAGATAGGVAVVTLLAMVATDSSASSASGEPIASATITATATTTVTAGSEVTTTVTPQPRVVTVRPTPLPRATVTVTKRVPFASTPRKATTTEPTSEPVETSEPPSTDAYYANCSAARAAGVAPLHTGDPGYRSGLDRDHDGVACE